jgi:hypothetical protein
MSDELTQVEFRKAMKKAKKYIDKIEQPFWDHIARQIKKVHDEFDKLGVTDPNEIGRILGIMIKVSKGEQQSPDN